MLVIVNTMIVAIPKVREKEVLGGWRGGVEGWRDGEMERWRDGEMERWRDGETEI